MTNRSAIDVKANEFREALKATEFKIDLFPESVQRDYLSRLLRGRKKVCVVGINGVNYLYHRRRMIEHLRTKFPDTRASTASVCAKSARDR